MWKLNSLTFDTFQDCMNFVASDEFKTFTDSLSPFIIDIVATEGDLSVNGKLDHLRTIWWDRDKLSEADWTTTYTTPHGQQDRDPLPVQKHMLSELGEIQALINRRLND